MTRSKQLFGYFVRVGAVFLVTLTLSDLKAENISYPSDSGVVNITSYSGIDLADNGNDDTAAIQQAIWDNIDAKKPIYFPNGTYNISNTLRAVNSSGEWRPSLMLYGQSRAGVIFKLNDSCSGFTDSGNSRGVIETGGINDQGGNTAFSNMLRNFTVHVGSNNPGAIGINYLGSNQSIVENILLKTGTGNSGLIGLYLGKGIPGPCLIKNVEVQGFAEGIRIGTTGTQYGIVAEHITLSSQRSYGIVYGGIPVSLRKLTSVNTVPAVYCTDSISHLVMIDSSLTGGSSSNNAVEVRGPAVLRNLTISGYGNAIKNLDNDLTVSGTTVSEYQSQAPMSLFGNTASTLNLSVEETPNHWNEDLSKWVKVEWPAGTTQIRNAIQKANDEGKDTIYFPVNTSKGDYAKIGETIRVWGSVRRFIGFGSGVTLQAEGPLIDRTDNPAVFKIEDITGDNVTFEGFNLDKTWGTDKRWVWFEQNTTKPLILKSLLTWKGSFYRNSMTGGKVFMEDIAGAGVHITGPQQAYLRQFNAEADNLENIQKNGLSSSLVNDGGTAWILGFKTEREQTGLYTLNSGQTESLGGLLYPARDVPVTTPAFVIEDASATLSYSTEAFYSGGDYTIGVQEIRSSVSRILGSATSTYEPRANPRRGGSNVPLFSGVSGSVETGNLARQKSTAVSSASSTTTGGDRAVDGSSSTAWTAGSATDPQWIRIDLGTLVNVNRVKLNWATAYQIQISDDASVWRDLVSVSGNSSSGVKDYTNLAGAGQYLRVNVTAHSGSGGVSLSDLQIYGTQDLARGRPASASSGSNSAYAVDGSESTVWTSSSNNSEWIQVDLGRNLNISRVTLDWDTAYGKDYTIKVSTDGTTWRDWQVLTGNTAAGILEHNASTGIGRYVRIQGVTRGTTGGYALKAFEVYGTADLAYGHSTTTSSVQQSGYEGDKAVDGNSGTRWSSNGSDPQSIVIDLGVTCDITRILLNWESAAGRDYKLQVSNDATTWTDAVTVTGNTASGWLEYTGLTASGRYVRMYGTARTSGWGYSLYDFKVYGSTPANYPQTTGTITREYWWAGGYNVGDIPVNTTPSGTETLTSLEGPTNWSNDYGARIRGTITTPSTGSYTFWMASDDSSELWLGTDNQAASKQLIASVSGWTNSRQWDKSASQKSASVTLTAGQTYYIEVLHKEAAGGDNLAVGWAKPGQSTSTPSEVVPGSVLTSY